MESIYIENFGGIKKMTLEINKINILIGPQASGKSVTAKLVYFFTKIPSTVLSFFEIKHLEPDLNKLLLDRFLGYFPRNSWPERAFRIEYKFEGGFVQIKRKSSESLPSLLLSEKYIEAINTAQKEYDDFFQLKGPLESRSIPEQIYFQDGFYSLFRNLLANDAGNTQFFIPAGRSFFAQVQASIFTILSNKQTFDPIFLEFGALYENLKQAGIEKEKLSHEVEVLINDVLSGAYVRHENKDWIYHNDDRKVILSNASSGQQEAVPLLFLLAYLPTLRYTAGIASIFIEEPEAHLFPSAQKKIVQLLARTANNKKTNFRLFITTHSPYILSSFNNLMEAGKIAKEQPEKQKNLEQVVPREEWLNPEDLNASSLHAGKLSSLIDPETKLISQNHLDTVSDELAIDFGKLLDIEY